MAVGSGESKAVTAYGGLSGGSAPASAPQSVRVSATPPGHSQYRDYVPGPAAPGVNAPTGPRRTAPIGAESYDAFADNRFRSPIDDPLSTFAIDVDTASYSNVRRFVTQGHRPPSDAVRVEEMINYFRYDYPEPSGGDPFAVYTEVGEAPWRPAHRLVHVGLQGRRVDHADRPASNLVFLLDVSGSMRPDNKLPLLKRAFRLLVGELDERDRVAIVTYAGHAGIALEPTSGAEKQQILEVVSHLGAGGSTAGAQGILTAYELARRNFIRGGINRVLLATDGDFNVGISDDGALVQMIEEERGGGVFLTVLGFGEGNLKDAKMHKLADKGNGSYHYIDSIFEAKKVLIDEMGATLQTIAKDVKIQVEFNPAHVAAYRLVGDETRLLAAEDFANDRKDAGELGAGHTVTALYEVIPRGVDSPELAGLEIPLKYGRRDLGARGGSDELLTVKLRYKQPDEDVSSLLTHTVAAAARVGECTDCFRFSAAVALFGMLLRDSGAVGDATPSDALELARSSLGADVGGHRRAFVDMVELYERQLATSLN
ncbi:VWA domain-containing protein [Candidatus Poribacteria bacterium]|nr:VWA domain-containing protein [Candidatus Poribacteria bacterium]